MNFTGSVEPALQHGSIPYGGFLFFVVWPRFLEVMRPFILDRDCIQGQIVPEFCFGFPNAFCHTVLSYYGCQVSEACNFTRLMALRILMSVQLLQKDAIASSSRQSSILFMTKRNPDQ